MSISIRFTVISSASCEAEIFDNLVTVRRHDTGETGTLLCSHFCRWPEELISQATWLEGCYTPKSMEGDSRLLMGYHPNELVSWSYNRETKEVELKLIPSTSQVDEYTVFPLPYNYLPGQHL